MVDLKPNNNRNDKIYNFQLCIERIQQNHRQLTSNWRQRIFQCESKHRLNGSCNYHLALDYSCSRSKLLSQLWKFSTHQQCQQSEEYVEHLNPPMELDKTITRIIEGSIYIPTHYNFCGVLRCLLIILQKAFKFQHKLIH